MRWTEADQRMRISRDDRFATFYPAQTLASCSAARSTCALFGFTNYASMQLTIDWLHANDNTRHAEKSCVLWPEYRTEDCPPKCIIVSNGDRPILRIDAFQNPDHNYTFHDALLWRQFALIGWGHCLFFVDLETTVSNKFDLNTYFGHLYIYDEFVLVTSCDRVWKFDSKPSLIWNSERIAVDGIVVRDVENGIIHGDAELDPPGGWQQFRLKLDSGKTAE